jgi:hypothetical protein
MRPSQVDFDFFAILILILPKILKMVLTFRTNEGGDGIIYVAAAAASNEYLKMLLQTPDS